MTTLKQLVSDLTKSYPDKTGFVLIEQGKKAFSYRSQLVDEAIESIEAQYYIWNDDVTGKLLAARIMKAAERDVRVRLLLDDVGSGNSEKMLVMMDAHPNIEIKIYNPVSPGKRLGVMRALSFLLEFSRLNLRMHNKIFLVDGCITIAGGRNIGDEYFDHHPSINFIDLDMMVIGENVSEVARSFDVYWNSPASLPLSQLTEKQPNKQKIKTNLLKQLSYPKHDEYPWNVDSDTDRQGLTACFSEMIWAESDFIYDRPLKEGDETKNSETDFVWRRLSEEFANAEHHILIESAYFIALDRSMQGVLKACDAGIDISVLTNSLATNDLWLMHAGYSATRRRLLQNGVHLFEFRPKAHVSKKLIFNKLLLKKIKVRLHAKAIVFDNRTVYVGSFNLNPRSVYLNSEIAFIVKSEALAQTLAKGIMENMQPVNSWQVSLDDKNRLQWKGKKNGRMKIYRHDPRVSFWRRIRNYLFSFFPFDRYY